MIDQTPPNSRLLSPDNGTNHKSISVPTDIHVSQSQSTISHASVGSTYHNTRNNPTENETTSTSYGAQIRNLPGVVLMHHDNCSNYVLEEYCRPVSDTFTSNEELSCKYSRHCIVLKTKILSHGEALPSLSKTAYKNNIVYQKFNYITMDTRFVQCFNKLCKFFKSTLPKSFHFICFKHMMRTIKQDTMNELNLKDAKDNIKDQIKDGIDIDLIQQSIIDDTSDIIFPVCGKRCYNTVCKSKTKKGTDGQSDYAAAQSWDNDGKENKRSSIEILIEWITTEENASKYFGGLDIEGKTSATRKEAYHHHIRDIIKNENGEFSI